MPKSKPKADLTTTGYAVLGLLGIQSWSTYELAQQMTRSLGYFWPRAQSKIYEIPKQLVARGFAKASDEKVGKRPRTVYRITPAGRRALARWLGKTADIAAPSLESEHLLRVFLAPQGTRQDLLSVLDSIHSWSTRQRKLHARIARGYLDGTGPFPERLAVLCLVGGFLSELAELVERWSAQASAEVTTWPDDLADAPVDVVRLRQIAG